MSQQRTIGRYRVLERTHPAVRVVCIRRTTLKSARSLPSRFSTPIWQMTLHT